jgi:hypothetical protein
MELGQSFHIYLMNLPSPGEGSGKKEWVVLADNLGDGYFEDILGPGGFEQGNQ